MADQEYDHSKSHEHGGAQAEVETKDRGMFSFLGKKKDEEKHDHHQEEVVDPEFNEKVKIEEETKAEEEGKKMHSLFEKPHRSGSGSISSSDEEGEGKEKKKMEGHSLGQMIDGEKKEEEKFALEHPPAHPEEKTSEKEVFVAATEDTVVHPEEKKGFIGKIKDKLPGQKNTTEEVHPPPPMQTAPAPEVHEGEAAEKKNILEKIKEKLPKSHAKEEKKEKESGPY